MKKLILKIKTFILMMIPIGIYIYILRKGTDTRLTNYAGIIGQDPKAYIVYHGIVLVDLNDMKV